MLPLSGLNKNNFSGVGVQWGGPKRNTENTSWGMDEKGLRKTGLEEQEDKEGFV